MTDEELMKVLESATDEQLRDVVTGVLFGGVMAATTAGVPPLKAIRGVVALYFEGSLTRGVWRELGVPRRTAERWRRDIREMLDEAPEIAETPSAEVLEAYGRLRAEKAEKDQKKAAEQ